MVYCAACGLDNPENSKYCRICGATLIDDLNLKRSAPYPQYSKDIRKMKRYVCVKLSHHKKVADTILEYQQEGWTLHTYSAAGGVGGGGVYHYLLFEKE